jgi:hypothetical protein
MSIYTDAQVLINSMFAPVESGGYGMTVTVNRYTPTVNVTTEAVTKGIATSTFTAGAVSPPVFNPNGPVFANGTQGQSLVGKTLRFIKLDASAATFEPRALDEVVIGSTTYQVLGCNPVSPAGVPIVYELGLVAL